MLKVDNLYFSYGRKSEPVVRDVSLKVAGGHVYGLLGKNGVGKSTLLYLMAGLLTPDSGSVTMRGVSTRERRVSTLADIFIVPEEPELPAMSMREYVRVNAPLYPHFDEEAFVRNVELFGLSGDMNLGRLSMGQKKKVSLCFALACNTSLLLLDEPTNGLDIPGKEAFRRIIAGSMTDERAIVISTHQVRDIDLLLDHVVILDDCRVVLDRSIGEIGAKLRFEVTNDTSVIKDALLAMPSPGGVNVVTFNRSVDDETGVDMEMLFSLATTNPGVLDYALRDNTRD